MPVPHTTSSPPARAPRQHAPPPPPPPPPQAEALHEISFRGLVLPTRGPPHTPLLDLDPLPLAVLGDEVLAGLYQGRFTHFNPIQTQVGGGGREAGGRGGLVFFFGGGGCVGATLGALHAPKQPCRRK